MLNHRLVIFYRVMKSRKKSIGIALLLCCIMIVAVLWLLGPRTANHFGWIWHDSLPDHVAYSGRIYAPANPYECSTIDGTPKDGLTQAGSVPAIFGAPAPLFFKRYSGNNPAYSLVMGVYVQKSAGCYVLYVIEGGP